MLLRHPSQSRRGTHAVEFALVSPILFFLLFGHIMGAFMVFQYVNTVNTAREGARWASVHGTQWQMDQINAGQTTQGATTATDIYTNAIMPKCVGFDTTNVNGTGPLSYTVAWAEPTGGQQAVYYDSAGGLWHTNTVTVTVSYQWSPVANNLYIGPKTVTSTATVAMQY